jgi:hypothetical protein
LASLTDLFAVNGQSDDHEPWTAGDYCDTIEIYGEDLVVLCDDGVARWTNRNREWTEVDTWTFQRTLEEVYGSGSGGNVKDAALFISWMEQFWALDESAREWLISAIAKKVRKEFPETEEMPPEVLADFLQDHNHPLAQTLLECL